MLPRYRCDNDRCDIERTSKTDLAIFGTCKECGTGIMRRVRERGEGWTARTGAGPVPNDGSPE